MSIFRSDLTKAWQKTSQWCHCTKNLGSRMLQFFDFLWFLLWSGKKKKLQHTYIYRVLLTFTPSKKLSRRFCASPTTILNYGARPFLVTPMAAVCKLSVSTRPFVSYSLSRLSCSLVTHVFSAYFSYHRFFYWSVFWLNWKQSKIIQSTGIAVFLYSISV